MDADRGRETADRRVRAADAQADRQSRERSATPADPRSNGAQGPQRLHGRLSGEPNSTSGLAVTFVDDAYRLPNQSPVVARMAACSPGLSPLTTIRSGASHSATR